MWVPVPKFAKDPTAQRLIGSPSYAMIWEPGWQRELGLSKQQVEKLTAVNAQAVRAAQERAAAFAKLTPVEQQAQIKARADQPASADDPVRQQIEALLTPAQLKTLKEHSFPSLAVGLLYDANVRKQIGLGKQQEESLRRVIQEKLTRTQQISLARAEHLWKLLTAAQQAALPEMVQRRGPTSKILSVAYDLGFDVVAMSLAYPLLAEAPVRELLKFDAEQSRQLAEILASSAQATKAPAANPPGYSDAGHKQALEALLTPEQLALLIEIGFRKQVALVLSYADRRTSLDMTAEQLADLEQLDRNSHDESYRADRELLARALAILTPAQVKQLRAEVERRVGG